MEAFGAADVQIFQNNTGSCYRIEESKYNSTKAMEKLVNQKCCKQTLYDLRKFKNFDESGIGIPNFRIPVNENLINSNEQLAFNCGKLKRARLILKT